MIPDRFSKFIAAVVAAILLVGANLDAADLSRARVRDNIVYFLEPSPAQLKRYDMAAQAWLAPLPAPAGATCFDIDTNAIYFGVGSSIHRSMVNGSNSTAFLQVTAPIQDIVVAGRRLVFVQGPPLQYSYGTYLGLADKDSPVLRDLKFRFADTGRLTFDAAAQSVFVSNPGLLQRFEITSGGLFANPKEISSYQITSSAPVIVAPDGVSVLQADSTLFLATDLAFHGKIVEGLSRFALNGASFLGSSGSNLIGVARGGNESGRVPLPFTPGVISVFSTNAFVFGGEPMSAMSVPLAAVGAGESTASFNPSLMNLQPLSTVVDTNGVVHLVDGRFPAIFRWSVRSNSWLTEIGLSDLPESLALDGGNGQLFVGAVSGKIFRVPLGQTEPITLFAQTTNPVSELVVAGDLLVAGSARAIRIWTFNSAGAPITNFARDFAPGSMSWSASTRLLWSRQPYGGSYQGVPISPSGQVAGEVVYAWGGYSSTVKPAPVLSPSGGMLLGLGGSAIKVADSSVAGTLGIEQTAALWNQGGLTTVRDFGGFSHIQRWNSTFQQTAGAFLEGSPLGIYEQGTNLLVVSRSGLELQFSLWEEDLDLLSASPVALPPTNVVYIGSGLNVGLSYGAVVGSLRLEPDLRGGVPTFEIRGQSPYANLYVSGTNLLYMGYGLPDLGTNSVRLTVYAVNQRGRGATLDVRVPIGAFTPATSGPPALTLERVSVGTGANPDRPALFVVRRMPPFADSARIRLQIGGTASSSADFTASWTEPYWSQPKPYYATIDFLPGQAATSFSVWPQRWTSPSDPKVVTIALDSANGALAVSTNVESVVLWPSGYAEFNGTRFGTSANVNLEASYEADFDTNGISNFTEFLFDIRPGQPGMRVQPTVGNGGEPRLDVTFRRAVPQQGEFHLLMSKDLSNWWPVSFSEDRILAYDGQTETVVWSVPLGGRGSNVFLNVRGAAYGRLRLPAYRSGVAGIQLVGVPRALTRIGSDSYESGRNSDEGPTFYSSFTKEFWVGRREISQFEYVALMTNNPSINLGPDLPVENVTWTEANEFCRRLSESEAMAGRLPDGYVYRLPTEAEWEHSARSGGDFPWGATAGTGLNISAWFAPNSFYVTHPVGRLAPNAYGLQDMLGNVAEWCADWYGPYPTGTIIDRIGPLFGTQRVIRGGNILDSETGIRAAARSSAPPEFRSRLVGFRVVLARPVQ